MTHLTVLILPVAGQPYFKRIDNTLEAMQAIVGGLIEYTYVPIDGVTYDIVCNEEGLFGAAVPNAWVPNLVGQLYVSRSEDRDDGMEAVSLTHEDQARLQQFFGFAP